jgi:hypothetical protein
LLCTFLIQEFPICDPQYKHTLNVQRTLEKRNSYNAVSHLPRKQVSVGYHLQAQMNSVVQFESSGCALWIWLRIFGWLDVDLLREMEDHLIDRIDPLPARAAVSLGVSSS